MISIPPFLDRAPRVAFASLADSFAPPLPPRPARRRPQNAFDIAPRNAVIFSVPQPLSVHAIRAHQKGHAHECALQVLDAVDSTNDEAARHLAAGRVAPLVILARRQTAGRGRHGRAWHAEDNGNLYASFGFRPRLPPSRMQTFTLWLGVNLCAFVENYCGVHPGLKWPNDLLFAGRKAGGMLTEARVDADEIRELVFGLGLNVNATAWPPSLSARAVSLAEVTGAPLELNRFTAALIGRVLLAYQEFIDGDHLKTFADQWQRYDVLRGRRVALLQGGRRHVGTAVGVDDEGSLLLREAGGRLERFHAGEVTLEKDL